jgi:surface antigen
MRKLVICAALAAATAVPAVASAQTRCVNPQTNATAGALVGAAGGALVGSQLADRGSRDKGAILGAIGGALIGGAVGNNQVRCPEGYYRYDESTRRYYDNSGAEYRYNGPPAPTNYGPPPPANYGPPPPANYGPPPPPAYGPPQPPPPRGGGFWQGAPERISDRIAFTEDRVRMAEQRRWIDRGAARQAYADLANLRRYDSDMRRRNGGHLRPQDRTYIDNQLNYISQRVRWESGR